MVKYFTKGAAQSDARATIFKKYKLAENLSQLDTPKINQGVMKAGPAKKDFTNSNEKTLYNIQNNVTRSAMAMTQVITHAMKKEEKGEMMNPKDVTSICLEAITLLGYVSKQISNRRKDNLRSYVNDDVRALCDHERPTTKWLLGDDLTKGAKDARELSKLSKKTNKPNNNWNNSSKQSSSSFSSSRDYNNRKYNSHQNSSNSSSSKPSFLSKSQKSKQKR